MPGMDGLSVLKAMRAAAKDLPVLFLTARGQVADRVEGLSAGGDDYLVKPFHVLEPSARNARRLVTRMMLLELVWNFNFEHNTTVVETHMSCWCAKIDEPFDIALIHTTRNAGYSWHGLR